MSEKRKPVFTFLLKESGKKSNRVEVFEAVEFENDITKSKINGKKIESSYRIRVNGVWFPRGKGKKYYWRSEIRDLIFKAIQF